MTHYEIERKVRMYSTEMLHEIIASDAKKWAWFRYAAKQELATRA